MRKGTLLNGPLTGLIGSLGHSDKIMVTDAGWPIPENAKIDLCLTHGIPRLHEVFSVIASELMIEKVIIDAEMRACGPQVHDVILEVIAAQENADEIVVAYEEHDVFKHHATSAKGIVRTGECIPYCNLVIVAGLAFTPPSGGSHSGRKAG
ncbi:D-ribose pyranase [Defluviimonas sp. SAOS-178_SWC]|uniref:D-ribose pyranase n=1 Tax=Defluviimonas sp. SAOS-178_SWC TaxID=3121287 RepID=UPI0032218D77